MSNNIKKIIIFLLLVVVGFLCGYIIKNKDKNYVPTPEVEESIKKEYNDREFVFNTSFSTETIVLPYINLDYSGVRSINFQIKNLYETNIKEISEASYQYFINDKKLSLLILVTIDNVINYYTYNINMQTGKELTYDEFYYKYSDADTTLKTKISDYVDNSEAIISYYNGTDITKDSIVEESYNNFKTNALSNNVKFYLDSGNNLNVIVKIEVKQLYSEYVIFQL